MLSLLWPRCHNGLGASRDKDLQLHGAINFLVAGWSALEEDNGRSARRVQKTALSSNASAPSQNRQQHRTTGAADTFIGRDDAVPCCSGERQIRTGPTGGRGNDARFGMPDLAGMRRNGLDLSIARSQRGDWSFSLRQKIT
jgi:hypothetical protein